MQPTPVTPVGLRAVSDPRAARLAVAERRVAHPLATLVCVHGSLDRGGSFARLARRTTGFDVVTYDRRGYQASRELGPLSLERHVSDLLAIVEREAGRGPVILFGHSFGGVVAFSATIRRPELVNFVVSYETPLPWVRPRPSSRPRPTSDAGAEAEIFFRRVVSNRAWERLGEAERNLRRLDGPALLNDFDALRGPAPFDLADLARGAAYLHGDGLLGPYYRALCRDIVAINPTIRTRELPGVGHGVHLTTPELLATAIRDLWEQTCESA